MIRAVFDTNILVSGTLLAVSSPPALAVRAASDGLVTLVTSARLLAEYRDVISRPHFTPRVRASGTSVAQLVSDAGRLAEMVEPQPLTHRIASDPDDDHVLACAVAGRAHYIVSGDKHLLTLGAYEGIRIVTAREFLTTLETGTGGG